MKKKNRLPEFRPKHIFFFLAAICVVLMIITSVSKVSNNVIRGGTNTLLMPLQKGFNFLGGGIFHQAENLVHLKQVEAENERLKAEIAELTEQNTKNQLRLSELANYQELLSLSDQYPDYDSVGAHIIGKNSDNWYKTILVDKGSRDGILVDMNVVVMLIRKLRSSS